MDFQDAVRKHLTDSFRSDEIVTFQQILKLNNLKSGAIIVKRSGKNIIPAICLKEYFDKYQKGITMEEITDEIAEILNGEEKEFDWELDTFLDFSKGKNRIVFRLVNYEKNRELLETLPHRRIMDMAVVYCLILMDSGHHMGSILIHHHFSESWGIGEEKLYQLALVNTPKFLPASIGSVTQLIEKLTKQNEASEKPLTCFTPGTVLESKLYVLTNSERYFGAAVILYSDLLEQIFQSIKMDFYLIPCSVHELLILPYAQEYKKEALKEMIEQINSTVVEKEEYLSDSLYYYSGSRKELKQL